MSQIFNENPLFQMIAATLQSSDAPRFLLSMFTNDLGEHQILIDHPEVDEADNHAWLLISNEDGIRIRLSFASNFRDEGNAMPRATTVWHHYLVTNDTFMEAKTIEETLPASFDYEVDISSIAANSLTIEDLCDACALPRDDTLRGKAAPKPAQSAPPFTGVL